jgi:hypothetical protein
MATVLLVTAAALLAGDAPAKINVMYVTHTSGPALCDHFTSNNLDYGIFMSQGKRIPVPRGTTIRVTLMGFGADFATGTEDNVTNLGSSIVGHGTTDDPAGGIHFGQADQIGYVTVEIRAHADAELGNGHVTVRWLTGTETIPLKIVASCGPTPTPAPTTAGGSHPPPPRVISGGSSAQPLLPDLFPADFQNVRRGIDTNADCNGAFTGQRRFTAPDLRFGVRNISATAVTVPFAVVLRRSSNGQVLQRAIVNGLAGNGVAMFDFRRPASDVCVVHGANGLGCLACPGTTPPDDRGLEVVVDADNAVTNEASETNNTLKIP